MTDEPRARVLVVDDDQVMCQFLTNLLGQLGFAVRCAGDGVEALDRIEDFNPDVVISDLLMPGMDGLSLLKSVAARRPEIRFVLITGAPNVAVAVEAISCGACDFVMKPIHPDRLEQLMTDVVAERRQTPRRTAHA